MTSPTSSVTRELQLSVLTLLCVLASPAVANAGLMTASIDAAAYESVGACSVPTCASDGKDSRFFERCEPFNMSGMSDNTVERMPPTFAVLSHNLLIDFGDRVGSSFITCLNHVHDPNLDGLLKVPIELIQPASNNKQPSILELIHET